VLCDAQPFVSPKAAVVSLAKGIEQGTLHRMTEVIGEVLDGHDPGSVGVLTGPNLAKEVAAGQPTASVVAVPDAAVAEQLQQVFFTPTLRVYTNPDVVGCEMAGALKNVLAIGAGIADGLGYGDNTKAALMTRGLAELARLGVACGGDPLTFAGLAGMGDLIATCSSPQSRNRHVGFQLGQGRSLDDIVSEMNMVAEGVKSTAAVIEIAQRANVEMPLAAFVGRVLYEGAQPADLVPELMLRKAKSELHGIR
jgi:glycerol-3-phosphate dehydrogenase (NAD(P)+)